MNITSTARQKLIEYLSKNDTKIPGIVWTCDEEYSDPVKEGYWQFGFYDLEQVKKRNIGSHLVDVEGINFAVDIPETLKSQFNKSLLDYIDSHFVISEKY